MKLIDVVSCVDIVEKDGVEVRRVVGEKKTQIHVTPHWNRSELVRLETDGSKYIVNVVALDKAVRNACNAHSF